MKYESIEQKILRIIYPPLLYLLICLATQMIAGTIFVWSDIRNTDARGVSATTSANYVEHINSVINKHSVLMNFIGAAIGLLIFSIIYRKDAKSDTELSFKRYFKEIKYSNILNSYSIGLTAGTGISLLISILPIDNILGSYESTSELLLNGNFIQLFLVLGVVVPLTEEMIYRGIVFNRIKKYLDVNKAILISALLFGMFHFNLMQGVYAFIIGVIMGQLYNKFDNILAPISLHMAVNQLTVIFKCIGFSDYIEKNLWAYILVMVGTLLIGGFLLYNTFKPLKISKS